MADIFHAWLRAMRAYDGYPANVTTRQEGEVQHALSPERPALLGGGCDIRLEIRRGVGFLVLLGMGGGPTSEKAKSISNSI